MLIIKEVAGGTADEIFDIFCGDVLAGAEDGVEHDGVAEWGGGLDTADEVFAEGAAHAIDGDFAGIAVGDEFTDHAIVVGGDGVAAVDMGVYADAVAAWGVVEGDISWGRSEILPRVFCVDAAFDGPAVAEFDIFLFILKFLAFSDEDLFFDEVDAGDFFGDAVFDLDTGIHFDEVEVAVFIDEEFDGACVFVFAGFSDFDGGFAHFFAEFGGEEG